MSTVLKRIAGSAPLWAWIVMAVCIVVLIVGLIISGNRTAPTSPAQTGMAATSVEEPDTPATVKFVEEAKANASTPKTIVLLGDSTGADPNGWAPALGRSISQNLERPVATRFWNASTNAYGPIVGLGDGTNGAVGFWNASASGKNVDYTMSNLDRMIQSDVTPDLILLNFGQTQDTAKPLAPQVQPLVTELRSKYPNASIAVIKQGPRQGSDSSSQLSGYASAMDAEGIQVIDVYSAFPTDPAGLSAVMRDTVNPNAQGQKLWTKTVLAAFGLPTEQ
ncbi:SGNH/GDSL hydrolase family protein [Gordonia sp. ABSL11-1]|uniref:SGNH/GDSL hydrolase family protein n=1 Tax=Gordonia sp. ABSL11-1 TaxID=3053924 RepID=UPI00257280FE|nr:SGNH/GDSL hydrolase family protein [Gordonia sp. ABSL11-1]MDL9948720.1 SGNH/GDSL hydrolase family protein [Gordonia sp. ABSL11-1]